MSRVICLAIYLEPLTDIVLINRPPIFVRVELEKFQKFKIILLVIQEYKNINFLSVRIDSELVTKLRVFMYMTRNIILTLKFFEFLANKNRRSINKYDSQRFKINCKTNS